MKVVGAYILPDGGHHQAHREVERVAWVAFHAKRALWNIPGQLRNKLKVPHSTVIARAPGSHDDVFGQAMARRRGDVAGLCAPNELLGGGDLYPCSHPVMGSRGSYRLVALCWALVPFGPQEAMDAVCEGYRMEGRLVSPHGLRHTDADPGRSRLSRGGRMLGKRHWDEAIQKHVMTEAREEALCQTFMEKRLLRDS